MDGAGEDVLIRLLMSLAGAARGFFSGGMDGGNARSTVNQKKPIVADNDLVELLWHNGSVVTHSQLTHRGQSASVITGEETAAAAWFPDTLDDALEKDLYAQLWHSIAGPTPDGGGVLPGPGAGSHPPPARPPVTSGMESSWTGDICSTFCGSNLVPEAPAGPRGACTHDGAGTSSSGGSGSNFGGSGLPSESAGGGAHHKRKGRGRDDSDSRCEDAECEATEETKSSSRRYSSKRRSRAAEVHNLSERRRRDRINEKMRALQELIPHCHKVDKASILDEAIEYLKSLQMQVQIMWLTNGMTPMMFPSAHQFMPPMGVGMNSACMPAAQGLNQMPRVPYMNHSLPNHIGLNSSPAMNPLNVANQLQNIHQTEASNPFLHSDDGQTVAPQVSGSYAYGPQVAQQNQILEVSVTSAVPASGVGQPTSDGT